MLTEWSHRNILYLHTSYIDIFFFWIFNFDRELLGSSLLICMFLFKNSHKKLQVIRRAHILTNKMFNEPWFINIIHWFKNCTKMLWWWWNLCRLDVLHMCVQTTNFLFCFSYSKNIFLHSYTMAVIEIIIYLIHLNIKANRKKLIEVENVSMMWLILNIFFHSLCSRIVESSIYG